MSRLLDFHQRAFPIVIAGHVDHGKSTLIGRLLYDTGELSADRLQEMRQSSSATGKVDEFAFVLDAFEEERSRGITIDTAQIFFSSDIRPYVIIDAPGHKEFIRNMLTGASLAEAAVLLIDAVEGIMEQTRRHAWLLKMVGISDICVTINKLDALGYDRERYIQLMQQVNRLFDDLMMPPPVAIVPISAREGENVASRSKSMRWYYGPSLIEVLDSFVFRPIEARSFRFPVQDLYDTPEGRVVVGRVEAGTIKRGDSIQTMPSGAHTTVTSIRKFPHDSESATYGDAVGIMLSVDTMGIERGDVLASTDLPTVGTTHVVNIFWFLDSYRNGDPVKIRCATQQVSGHFLLQKVYDPADPDNMEQSPELIGVGEVARATLFTEKPLVADYATFVPELGRFVVECNGKPSGAGLIL